MKLTAKQKQLKKRCISFFLANLIAFGAFIQPIPVLAIPDDPNITVDPINRDRTSPNDNESQDIQDTARMYANNTPIRLEVSKVKTHVGDHEGLLPNNHNPNTVQDTITYKWSGRIDGTEAELVQAYGAENIELAYNTNGIYLGYGWKKGTFEYLSSRLERQDLNNEIVEIKYNEYGIFEGYAYITKKLETADDYNRYVAGAVMTLYDAVEIFKSPELTGDDRFPGVVIKRNANNDITQVYVQKGYSGNKVEYVLSNGDEADAYSYDSKDEINDTGEGTWITKTIERSDTPILYYNLNDLRITTNDRYFTKDRDNKKEIDKVFGEERYNKEASIYGFDRNGNIVNINQRDEYDFSVFAFRGGETNPIFEFVGGDFSKIKYNGIEKLIEVDNKTIIYHLDQNGNRDAKVDPRTGVAYITEEMTSDEISKDSQEVNIVDSDLRNRSYKNNGRIYVWPVNIYKDGTGSETFEKIKTNRVATINEDTEDEYVTGTYTGTEFLKKLNPTFDENGMPVYYQKSDEPYIKGHDRYDRDGDYLGYSYNDELDNDNENAYQIKNHNNLYNGDKDNPFDQSTNYQYSKKQKIKLTVDVDGNYIVGGDSTVPIPVRNGHVFGGWLITNLGNLKDGDEINSRWLSKGSQMPDNQKYMWYSNREATGTTKTITVIFNATEGEFRDGSGAIHSADNKLYYRQGENYIIENTWVTGENTPNNPFDDRAVAITDQTNNTANDPYKAKTTKDSPETQKGGTVDMIKRIEAGKYIMEEVKPPSGYVKGLPVGIFVRENEVVQTSEMVDTTIKFEISKIDKPEDYLYNMYQDGELVQDAAGVKREIEEPKGSFSYINVPGAVLAIFGNNKDNTEYSNWIKATKFVETANKRYDDVHGDYIVVDTSKPVFIEGLPAGNYIISEIVTPNGYITAPDTKIQIADMSDVQLSLIPDDHTKVEIKKYYNNGNGDIIMPNMYRAGLELKDQAGVVASWYTDDCSDYKEFISTYNQLVIDKNGPNFDTISWNAERTAILKTRSEHVEKWIVSDGSIVVIENNMYPSDMPEEFKDAYETRNMDREKDKFSYTIPLTAKRVSGANHNQIWEASNNTKIFVSSYGDNQNSENGKPSHRNEYKFNYKNDYSGKYENMVSYDTVDGLHRFDYIPEGSYVLHEFDVPKGFMQAEDKQIIVNGIEDIQQFTMENKQREMVITKIAQDADGKYYAGVRNNEIMMGDSGIEIPGAKLRLYKADKFSDEYKALFKQGKVPSGVVSVTDWVSGSDGKYTEVDERKERIPAGYEVGDYKPHIIEDLEDGFYYLVEEKTPDYYQTMEPMELEVNSQKGSATVVNKVMPGKVSVQKNSEDGIGLPDATFVIRNKTKGTVVGTIVTGADGIGSLIVNKIGEIGEDGNVVPYTFTIEEMNPPAGYQINSEIHEFQFNKDDHNGYAISYNVNDASHVDGVITILDKKTAITISKSDFDTHLSVAGATLEVYEAAQEEGVWAKTENLIDRWKTQANNNTHVISGLVGSKNYVLVESVVPDGYTKAKDIYFRISSDGKIISKIWEDKKQNAYVEFIADNTQAVERVNIASRMLTGSKAVFKDLTDPNKKPIELGFSNDGFTLKEPDVIDGHTYSLEEVAYFNDTTSYVIRSTTFIAKLNNGEMKLYPGYASSIENVLLNKNGSIIAKWNPDANIHSIANPLHIDNQGITVKNTQEGNRINGQDHSAISIGEQVIYTIKYEGAGKEVILSPDPATDIIRTEPAVSQDPTDGKYKWITEAEKGEIKFIATVDKMASGHVNQKVTIDNKTYYYMNPVAHRNGEGTFKGTSKIVLYNDVIGNDPNNESATFTYEITLTNQRGGALAGSYDYRTKNENNGTHSFDAYEKNTKFEVVLSGSDYVVISDLPKNTVYSVKLKVTDDFDFVTQFGATDDEGNIKYNLPSGITKEDSVSNIYVSDTRNLSFEREIFKRNENYELVERLVLSDNSMFSLAQYGFTLGEKCEVVSFDMKNRKSPVIVSKKSVTGEDELPGATLQVIKDGNILEQWVSTEAEHKLGISLQPGETYILREIIAPDGYAYSNDITFTVLPDGTINKVVMYDDLTRISIKKEDETHNLLAGAILQIIDRSGKVVEEWVSDGEIYEINNKLIAGETYTLHEVKAPNGYGLAADVPFTVPKSGTITVSMTDTETKVGVTKKSSELDEDGNNVILNGVILQILDENKNAITAIKDTDTFKKGDLLKFESHETADITGLLNAGTLYYLREVKPLTGYVYAEDVPFAVNEDGSLTSVEMVDKPIEMDITKTDVTGEEELPGATLQVIDKNKTIVYQWVSTETPYRIGKKLIAGDSYLLREIISPDGYSYISDIEFKVEKDGTITVSKEPLDDNHLFVNDKPTKVEISKVDITNNQELPGSHLEIRDMNHNLIEEWVSTDKPHVIQAKLIASTPDRDGDGDWDTVSKYKLIERLPADGFAYANEIIFTVSPDGTIDKVKMEDKPTHAEITKTDITNDKEVPGAHLQVKDKNGTIIEEWVSTDKPYAIKAKLKANETYILHEERAPDGYNYTADIEFTVSPDGTVDKVEMKDAPSHVEITKSDITTGEELPGATLQIINKNGNVIEEWISAGKPHVMIAKLTPGETYILREKGTPDGYGYAEDVEFTVSESATGVVDKAEMKDKPTHVEITKSDITTGEELPGAKLQIIDKNGNVIEEWISTDKSHVITHKLIAGETYILHEADAPDGYAYSEDVEFTVSKDGSIDKVEMKDKPTHVEITKNDITGEKEIPGATLQIKDEYGTIIEEWVSTDKPHVIIGKLEAGKKYYLHEENAPDGYGYSEDIEFIVSKDGSINKVDIKDDTLKLTIIKWAESKGELNNADKMLGGAKMQIKDSEGNVVDEWITESGKPYEIASKFKSTGIYILPDEVYTLIEAEAPDGYTKAGDQTFTANHDGTVKILHVIDEKPGKPWTPEGEIPKKPIHTPEMTITKKNGANMSAGVSGAEYTIYNPDGSVYKVAVTDENGYAAFTVPKNGTYTYRETKAPEGFMPDKTIYSFTVKDGTVSGTLNVKDYPKFEVEIFKKDMETKEVLANAEFEIYNSKGELVGKGTTGLDGIVPFIPEYDDTYTVIEVKAPEGYDNGKVFIKFTVKDGKLSGETTIYNSKNEEKIGRISANYDKNKGNNKGNSYIDENGQIHFYKTGDINLALVILGWTISIICLIGFMIRRKCHGKK